ncbi:ATP-binding cassette domain-containing protein [Microbacterium sp. NPDC076895]|uniref:ABC transporter ATP-binding protein n=1 Tax=Microbacterium sp. NPDC076895 TaxID=3154957 RepID=UPI0034407693
MIPSAGGMAAAPGSRPMIVAQDAHVTYRVYASGKRMTARDSLLSVNALRGGRGLHTVPALRGVSFIASEGETIGVIGHNGSGKSTLFRAMSGLIPTSAGKIWAADRPVLLGVNAALVPELSGENNIKLGLLAMGFTTEEAAARVDEIADFAELNEFLYHPMRTYSSGMGARLRFAIASAKAHSILLIDEALSVGDRRFKLKSEERIRSLRDSAGLVMIVSHSAGTLRETCERVLWIHKGELRADGAAKDVIADYVKWTKQPGNSAVGASSARAAKRRPAGSNRMQAGGSKRSLADGAAAPVPVSPSSGRTNPSAAKADEAPTSSPLEKMLVNVSEDVRELVSPEDGGRALARRERYMRNARNRYRRRIIALVITSAAVLLAIAAGAAIALVAAVPHAVSEPVRSNPTTKPSASFDPAVTPVISGFSATSGSVVCAAPDAEATALLSWDVSNAVDIAVAGAAVQVDAIDAPAETGLPGSVSEYAAPFPCDQEAWSYTLTVQGADGAHVSSVVTVTRDLADSGAVVPAPQQPADPGTSEQQNPGQSPNQTDPGTGGAADPSTSPSPDPVPTATANPEPTASTEPTTNPDPTPTDSAIVPDPGATIVP